MTIHVKKVKNLLEKMLGLIGKKTPYPLLLKTRFGIHTFGLMFPIDVIILNEKGKVVKTKQNLLPNRVFFWKAKYNIVLELPAKTIEKKNIRLGETIDFR